MPYDISVAVVTPRLLAAARAHAALAELPNVIRPLFDIVYAHLRASAIPHLGLNVILYEPPQAGPAGLDVDFECGVEVTALFEDGEAERCVATPSGRVATAAHFGDYAMLHEAHAA